MSRIHEHFRIRTIKWEWKIYSWNFKEKLSANHIIAEWALWEQQKSTKPIEIHFHYSCLILFFFSNIFLLLELIRSWLIRSIYFFHKYFSYEYSRRRWIKYPTNYLTLIKISSTFISKINEILIVEWRLIEESYICAFRDFIVCILSWSMQKKKTIF